MHEIISTLLHDFCKCSGMYDIHGHGLRSAEMLERLGLKLSREEWLAIRYHMRLSGHRGESGYLRARFSRLRTLVHMADIIFSIRGH